MLKGIGIKHVSGAITSFPNNQNAVMTVSKAGFEVTVEELRTMCGA